MWFHPLHPPGCLGGVSNVQKGGQGISSAIPPVHGQSLVAHRILIFCWVAGWLIMFHKKSRTKLQDYVYIYKRSYWEYYINDVLWYIGGTSLFPDGT